jgi:tetratricopeptide (TPR) repeat protein
VGEPEPRRGLALEADEMRSALRGALDSEPNAALRIVAALWRFWHDRGDRTEGARWLEQALRAAPDPSPVRAAALHGLSVLALRISDHSRALKTAKDAIVHFRDSGDRHALSEELHHLGTLAWVFADYPTAVHWCQESRRIAEQEGLTPVVASVLHTLGVIEASRNETDLAKHAIERSVELLRELPGDGDPLLLPVAHGYAPAPGPAHRHFLEQTFVTARRVRPAGAVPYALCDLAATLRNAGHIAESRQCFEESVSLFRRCGDDLGSAQGLCQLGNLLAYAAEYELARELHEESLALREAGSDARGIGLSLLSISTAAIRADELDRAQASADRAMALFNRTDDVPGQGAGFMQLGYVAAAGDEWLRARELQERSLSTWRSFIPNARWCGGILLELATIDAALGDHDRVPMRLAQALESYEHIGDQVGVEQCRTIVRELANGALTAG